MLILCAASGQKHHARRMPRLFFHDVAEEPVVDLVHPADTMLGLAGTGQLMVFPVEDAHSGGNTLQLQSRIHLDYRRCLSEP